MSSLAPGWDRTGWLPKLTIIEWPRLEKLRREHEAAVKARDRRPEDPAALSALVDVIERACRELDQGWSEVEALCAEEHVTTSGPAAEADQRALRVLLRTLHARVLSETHILPGAVYEARKALSKLAAAV